tara:strand:- start:7976 stop:8434 length:459 start_codon:yes stop_codon:yes gene_type:complete
MKILLTLGLAAGAWCLLPAFVSTSPSVLDPEPSFDVQEDEPTPLQLAMRTLGDSIGKVRKLAKDPKSKELLPLLVQAEAAAMSLLVNPPEDPDDLKDAALTLWKISFRQEALALAQDILNLQVAVVNQDADAIQKGLKALGDREGSGHMKFG